VNSYVHKKDCDWFAPNVDDSRLGEDGVPRIITRDPVTGVTILAPCSCWKPLRAASERLRRRNRKPHGIDALMEGVLTPPSGSNFHLVARAAQGARGIGRN